jgi:hypothetical protein
MCEPNPITLFLISVLNPVITATETIITAKPSAIPKSAIRIIFFDKNCWFDLSKNNLFEIKSSVFIPFFSKYFGIRNV